MNLGLKMSLQTRLSSKSKNNNKLEVKDNSGKVVAAFTVLNGGCINLEVSTDSDYYVSKDNGWDSKR